MSVDTVRRRIKRGLLPSRQVAGRHGPELQVELVDPMQDPMQLHRVEPTDADVSSDDPMQHPMQPIMDSLVALSEQVRIGMERLEALLAHPAMSRSQSRRACSEGFLAQMVERYGPVLGGEDGVRERVAEALSHKSSANWRDVERGVSAWLRREAERNGAGPPGPRRVGSQGRFGKRYY